jgi:hypothetical protein
LMNGTVSYLLSTATDQKFTYLGYFCGCERGAEVVER